MKSLFLTATLGLVCASSFAQGTLNFANFGPGVVAKISSIEGTPLAGTNFSADLYWAEGIVTDIWSLQPLQAPAFFSSDPSEAGYFLGGPRTIPAPVGSTITAQVRVWATADGSSWLEAGCNYGQTGMSILFTVTLAAAPETANMTGLNGHPFSSVLFLPDVGFNIQDVVVQNNQVEFTIVSAWWQVQPVVEVSATTNLTNPVWSPVQTFNCVAGPVRFSDSIATNVSAKSYRVYWGWGNGTILTLLFAPQLTIDAHESNVVVAWPTNFIGFALQFTTNLASGSWTTSSLKPSVVNDQNVVTNPISGTQQFFRLSQ